MCSAKSGTTGEAILARAPSARVEKPLRLKGLASVECVGERSASLLAPYPGHGPELDRNHGPAVRWAAPRAEQLRESRLPGGARRRLPRRRQVLPSCAMERCADSRGASLRHGAREIGRA